MGLSSSKMRHKRKGNSEQKEPKANKPQNADDENFVQVFGFAGKTQGVVAKMDVINNVAHKAADNPGGKQAKAENDNRGIQHGPPRIVGGCASKVAANAAPFCAAQAVAHGAVGGKMDKEENTQQEYEGQQKVKGRGQKKRYELHAQRANNETDRDNKEADKQFAPCAGIFKRLPPQAGVYPQIFTCTYPGPKGINAQGEYAQKKVFQENNK